jgi:hypothetical protein
VGNTTVFLRGRFAVKTIKLQFHWDKKLWLLEDFVYTDLLKVVNTGFMPHLNYGEDYFFFDEYLPVALLLQAYKDVGYNVVIGV